MTSLQKPVSRAAEKRAAKRERAKVKRNVYAFVSARDGFKCRACDRRDEAMHHHHIRFRSKGGNDTSDNLLLLCPVCHADVHAYRLIVTGDGNGSVTFENAAGRVWVR